MPIFQWKARTRQGSLKKGEIEALNEAAVMAQLRSQMLLPVTVKEKAKDVSEYLPFLKQGIKTRELVIFTRQFATMIDAGLPLVQCLDILGNQNTNKTFKEIIRQVKGDVEQGSTFADALRHRLGLRPVATGGEEIAITVSIGVATMRPGEDLDVDGLVARVSEALDSARSAGGDRIALDRLHGLVRLEDPHERSGWRPDPDAEASRDPSA